MYRQLTFKWFIFVISFTFVSLPLSAQNEDVSTIQSQNIIRTVEVNTQALPVSEDSNTAPAATQNTQARSVSEDSNTALGATQNTQARSVSEDSNTALGATQNTQALPSQVTESTIPALPVQEATLNTLQTSLQPQSKRIINWSQVSFENDDFSTLKSNDDGYSNGLFLLWGKANYNDFYVMELPQWLRYISDWKYINQGASNQYSVNYSVSQLIYTPDKLTRQKVIESDRPYAGLILWETKIRSYADNRANGLGLTLGFSGPASLASKSQTLVHKSMGANIPKGWDNQVNNEFVFRVEGEHIRRFYEYAFTDDVKFDSSAYSEFGFGNLRSDLNAGLTMRVGNMLDQTYASISPHMRELMSTMNVNNDNKLYWQLFSNIYGNYVFNDITLNGNVFSDSHSVKLVHEQLMLSAGAALSYQNWGLTFSLHVTSNQFHKQKNISKYGALTMSYNY